MTPRPGLGRVAAILALVLAAALSPAIATSYRFLELDALWARAEIAVFGTVASVRTEEREGEPWTIVTIAVERRLGAPVAEGQDQSDQDGDDDEVDPGDDPNEMVEIALLGGTLNGGRTLTVALMPTLREDDRILLLAYDEEGLASPIVGFRQGLWRLTAEGLIDEAGRRLSLADGALRRDGEQGELNPLLDAVDAAIREAP